jgi:predicted PurR-regulated permease PerM
MVPWAAADMILGDYRHALGLMAVWGLVALFRRVAEPKILGDQTGLSPLLSLVSVYVGMKLRGVAGMILGPILCLVALNLIRSGVLDRSLADLRLAVGDLSAILRGESSQAEKKPEDF